MPTTGNTCRMEEGEEKSLVTRPVVVINLQQMMNEVEATMKRALSCINDNQVLYQDKDNIAYLYLDPLTTSTLQFLYEDLRKKQRSMVTYGAAMSNETSIRYNHIHAEAVQALTNIPPSCRSANRPTDHPQK